MLVAYRRLYRHCRNLTEGGCLLSRYHFMRCCYFFAPRHLSEFTLAGPLLLLPAALEVQIYEVNFFCVSVTPLQFHFASK